jgi:uncharacterized membrane protein YoaK (UPF0700 family)
MKSALARTALAVLLTWIAGYVDAIGWLNLHHVYTAQMSGNVILLAVHFAAGEKAASLPGDAVLSFFLGLVISGSVIEIGMRRHIRRIFVAALAVEFVLIAAFALVGVLSSRPGISTGESAGLATYALIAIVAFAMGTQNTSLRMAGILGVFTTHVTGTLTGLSEEVIVCAFSLLQPDNRRRLKGGFIAENLRGQHRTAFENIRRSTALLLGFFVGALIGAALLKAIGLGWALGVPLALLGGIGIVDWVSPLTEFPSAAEKE